VAPNVADPRRPAPAKGPADKGSGAPAGRTGPLSITLLGSFEIERANGEALRLPKKAQALIAYLALQKGRLIPREQLATLLWGNSATEQARQSLRQCLAALRNSLGTDASEVVADIASVRLAPSELLAIDVAAFETACRSNAVSDLERANMLYRDELLAGLQVPVELFNDWLTLERQRLFSLHLDALQRLALAKAETGALDDAIAASRQITVLDPLREEGHRLLMRLLAASGNRSAALKQHEQCAQILRDELGIPPDAETERLAEAIRAGANLTPKPSASSPPLRDGRPVPAPAAATGSADPQLPEKPSIVVLPFANLSGDASRDYFVDGLVEDITVALGRESWLFVISSPSAFAFRDRAIDPREVAAKLGVRYVLRGSVRRAGDRVRIVVQLTDAATGAQIWGHQFEDVADNVFAMNDRLMTQGAAMIAPALRGVEIARAQRKPTESLTAFDLYLQALPLFRKSLADNRHALQLLDKAIAIDGSYSTAFGLGARCYQFQKLMGWVPPSDPGLEEGVRLAHRAAELGSDDSEALWMAGLAMAQLVGEIDHGQALIDRSLFLNPNSANALSASCLVRTYSGDTDRAIEHFHFSQRLNPLDQLHHVHWNIVGMAYFAAGRYEEAAAAADKALQARPTYPPGLRLKIATCGLFGRIEEGQAHLKRLLSVHPECSVAWIREFWGPLMRPRTPATLEKYIEGSRLVGLPEQSPRSA
jgi:DNA-binding SARP family transcriptional activator/TolB-like protein